MEMESTTSIFEAFVLFKRIPYWLFWLGFGIFDFILGEVLICACKEKEFFYPLLMMSFSLASLPILNIWFFYAFKRLMQDLSALFWDNNTEFEIWYKNKEKSIFTLKTWHAKFVTGSVFIAGLVTIFFFLGLPFGSIFCNIPGLSAFAILLIFSGITLHTSIGLLSTLREIVKRPIRTPFFMIQNSTISKLQNYYLLQSIFVVSYYVGLVIAIWQGPYGFNNVLLIWLACSAFYPLFVFLLSFYQIHCLMRNIKQTYVVIMVVVQKILILKQKLVSQQRI
jgi:hypothetical protein